MNQLFKKTGNNNFQLLTENVNTQPKTHEVIQLNNGLKKIFCEGVDEISYNKVQNMGFGFIKDIHSAKLVALEESRIIAEEFGYRDDVDNAKFVKEDQDTGSKYAGVKDKSRCIHCGKLLASLGGPCKCPDARPIKEEQWNIQDFDTPEQIETKEEKREVQIGQEILNVINSAGMDRVMETEKGQLRQLANELIQMPGAKK
jgi:phage FluMu protein Com